MAIQKRYKKHYEALTNGLCDYEGSEPVKHIYERFVTEYDWRIKQVGFFKALTEWLQGLALNIPYTYYDIMKTFKMNERQAQAYFPFMAMRLQELFKKEGLI